MARFDESDESWDGPASDGDVDRWDEQALGQFASQLVAPQAGAAGGLGADFSDELRNVSPPGDESAGGAARADAGAALSTPAVPASGRSRSRSLEHLGGGGGGQGG
eukprot:3642606-Prymnesium_polylepis.1